jgi:hypothetical protein
MSERQDRWPNLPAQDMHAHAMESMFSLAKVVLCLISAHKDIHQCMCLCHHMNMFELSTWCEGLPPSQPLVCTESNDREVPANWYYSDTAVVEALSIQCCLGFSLVNCRSTQYESHYHTYGSYSHTVWVTSTLCQPFKSLCFPWGAGVQFQVTLHCCHLNKKNMCTMLSG